MPRANRYWLPGHVWHLTLAARGRRCRFADDCTDQSSPPKRNRHIGTASPSCPSVSTENGPRSHGGQPETTTAPKGLAVNGAACYGLCGPTASG
jgi:hypothetical protein